MNLSIIKREVEIGLLREGTWQDVPIEVCCEVIIAFVIANPRHKGSIGCKFLSQFTKKIPNWCTLSSLFAVHACIGNIPSQEDKRKGSDEVVFSDLINYEIAERSKSTHISKDCYVQLI